MTVTPNVPMNARQAPRWLRVVTGCLLFLALWVVFVLLFGEMVPRPGALAPALWLSALALPAGFAAWLVVRRASARLLAPLAVIVLVGIGVVAAWLAAGQMLPLREAKSGASTAPREEAPRPTETAEVPLPLPRRDRFTVCLAGATLV